MNPGQHRHRAGRLLRGMVLPALIVLVALFGAQPATVSAGTGTLATWVEVGPAGRVFARAVTSASACPSIVVDGRAGPMPVRAEPAPAASPVRICEARIPSGTRTASIDRRSLPIPSPDPQRILVIGDTGCRLKGASESGSGEYQACNDPAAWPFARIATTAADWQPDLVIHVGDYVYREAPCPAGDAGCAGSPWGDTWAAWDADFFTPAAPLLRAAPWVFVRGNHEICGRSGDGWFRLLDPYPLPDSCRTYTEPYAVPLGDLQLLMLDSSNVSDYQVEPDQVQEYRRQFAALRDTADTAWLLTHDPLWVFGHAGVENGVETLFRDNQNLQQASAGLLPSGLRLVLSGHIHLFQALQFDGDRPPQIVAGMSGTALDPPVMTPLAGLEIDGMRVTSGTTLAQFGFVTMARTGDAWLATLHGVDGRPILSCGLRARVLRCDP